jgi:hypothetical protein
MSDTTTTTTEQPDYYTRGLAVSDALARDEVLRIEFNDGAIADLEGRELFQEWDSLAPGETFDILGRVDAAGNLRPVDFAALQGAPSDYRPGRVTIWVDDEVGSIPAIVKAWDRWNGFALPLFTREALIASADALRGIFPSDNVNEDSHEGTRLSFDADGFPSIIELERAEGGEYFDAEHPEWAEQVSPVEIDGVTYYGIGYGGYVWEDAPADHDHYYDSAASAWQCRYCGTSTDSCTKLSPV